MCAHFYVNLLEDFILALLCALWIFNMKLSYTDGYNSMCQSINEAQFRHGHFTRKAVSIHTVPGADQLIRLVHQLSLAYAFPVTKKLHSHS